MNGVVVRNKAGQVRKVQSLGLDRVDQAGQFAGQADGLILGGCSSIAALL